MATGTFYWFNGGLATILDKKVDLNSDTLMMQLHTVSYVPNRTTHNFQDDLTNEVANGNGYATGGKALATPTVTVVDDADATAWAVGTAYVVGQVRRPTSANGYLYRCSVAGTSHAATEPTWPTVIGREVNDNGVIWTCVGVALIKFDAADPAAWTSSTFDCRYGVIVDTTPGTAATNPLIGYLDFGEDVSPSAGSLTITFHAEGIANFFS